MTEPVHTWPIPKLLSEIGAAYKKERIDDFWQVERPHVERALRALMHRLPARYTARTVLGVGGSGIVLRLTDKLFPDLDNALKFPRPVAGKIELVAEMLVKEMAFLAKIRHEHIVKILYFTQIPDVEPYGKLPFYLMEAVDGQDSRKFAADKNTTQEQFSQLVAGTAHALAYLHNHSSGAFAHLDVKPENIRVSRERGPVLIDLGTCKRMSTEERVTIVACTKEYAHPELVNQLASDPSDANRARGSLHRSDLNPAWDLWSFGLSILEWLGVDRHTGKCKVTARLNRLTPYARKYYLLLVARLLSYSEPNWLSRQVGLDEAFLTTFAISNSDELLDAIQRLGVSTPFSGRVPELIDGLDETIQAGARQHVRKSPRLAEVLDHRLFRRLNGITQLGLVSQVFPGAQHSRREHSLGTYANAGRLIRALWQDSVSPLFRQIVSEQDCKDLLLASLLHDIGQYPLAHDLEEIDKALFSHADITVAMLRGQWSKKKKGSRPVDFDSLKDVFHAWGTSADRVIGILGAKPATPSIGRREKLLRSIISGPIDADKMDYLPRDAGRLNLPYPNGIDMDRILTCITTVVLDRVDDSRFVPMIGVNAKGRVAAEFLILARYAMFCQAYWHHTVRAQKAMLARAVGALIGTLADERLREFQSDFVAMVTALPESLYGKREETVVLEFAKQEAADDGTGLRGALREGTDLAPTDAAVLSWLANRLRDEKRPESELIEGLLRRRLYKRLWVVSQEKDRKRFRGLLAQWDKLTRASRHKVGPNLEKKLMLKLGAPTPITTMDASTAREQIEQRTAGGRPWIVVDVPGERPGAQVGLRSVLEEHGRRLRKDNRSVGDLQESSVWKTHAGGIREAAGKIRVFCHPGLVDVVDASIDSAIGLDELGSVLRDLVE